MIIELSSDEDHDFALCLMIKRKHRMKSIEISYFKKMNLHMLTLNKPMLIIHRLDEVAYQFRL